MLDRPAAVHPDQGLVRDPVPMGGVRRLRGDDRPLPAPERTHQPPALLVDTTLRGVHVRIRRSSTGTLSATTELGGELLEWDSVVATDEQVRELAACALALHRHGERGDRQGVTTYDSCSGGAL